MKSLAGSGKLRHVALVFRHGDRAPAAPGASGSSEAETEREAWSSTLPSADLAENLDKAFPVKSKASVPPKGTDAKPFEMLTSLGGQQLQDFGQRLRQHYGLLPMEVAASNYRRTQQSAQFFLLGYQCGGALESLNANLEPVLVRDTKDCVINAANRYWDDLLPLLKRIEVAEKFAAKEEAEGLSDVKEQLNAMPLFGADGQMPGRFSWLYAWDVLTCLRAHQELPKLETLHSLMHLQPKAAQQVLWRWTKYYEDPEVLRMTSGDLLQEVSMQMENCTHDDKPAKLVVYSGHDTTLIPVLKALSLWDGTWPTFAAEMRLELWKMPEAHSGDTWCVRAVGSEVGGVVFCCSLRDFQLRVQQVVSGAGPILPPKLWWIEE